MTNTFLDATAQAMRVLERAQVQRDRREARAQRAFDRANARYRADMSAAATTEGAAWRTLLDVPGMTVSTAAALSGTSIATIHRRVREAGHAG
jgi:hypothetical protein